MSMAGLTTEALEQYKRVLEAAERRTAERPNASIRRHLRASADTRPGHRLGA